MTRISEEPQGTTQAQYEEFARRVEHAAEALPDREPFKASARALARAAKARGMATRLRSGPLTYRPRTRGEV